MGHIHDNGRIVVEPQSNESRTESKPYWNGMKMFFEEHSFHETAVEDLKVSASQGCHLCNLLIRRQPH